jgi:hypothetical protein
MRGPDRQAITGTAVISAVVLPLLAGYATAGVGLAFLLGAAALVLLATLDELVLEADRFGVGLEGGVARAEMSTKQLIATGGATVSSVGIVGLIKQDVVGGIIYALTYGFVGLVNGLFDRFGKPIVAIFDGVADIIGSALTGSLIDAGFRVAARDLQSYGIIAPIVAGVITFGLAAILYVVLRRVDFSPLQLVYDKIP